MRGRHKPTARVGVVHVRGRVQSVCTRTCCWRVRTRGSASGRLCACPARSPMLPCRVSSPSTQLLLPSSMPPSAPPLLPRSEASASRPASGERPCEPGTCCCWCGPVARDTHARLLVCMPCAIDARQRETCGSVRCGRARARSADHQVRHAHSTALQARMLHANRVQQHAEPCNHACCMPTQCAAGCIAGTLLQAMLASHVPRPAAARTSCSRGSGVLPVLRLLCSMLRKPPFSRVTITTVFFGTATWLRE